LGFGKVGVFEVKAQEFLFYLVEVAEILLLQVFWVLDYRLLENEYLEETVLVIEDPG
jgi:hypothetical protein